MKLTKDNYYSKEANMEYMSASQFKDFMKCEIEGFAKAIGEYVEKPSNAMLLGSYVDAYFSDELEDFVKNTPQIFKKDGTLLKDFVKAQDYIKAIESDEFFNKYNSCGKKQIIMVGEIAGVKFKIKIDNLFQDCIVDRKLMASYKEYVWIEREGRNIKVDFVDAYGYDIQGAIYQEIVRQNIGKQLPFILAVTTKEENPDKALIQIDQEYLDKALQLVRELAPRYDLIKHGVKEPIGCGKCPSCRKDLKVTKIVSYKDLFSKYEVEEND